MFPADFMTPNNGLGHFFFKSSTFVCYLPSSNFLAFYIHVIILQAVLIFYLLSIIICSYFIYLMTYLFMCALAEHHRDPHSGHFPASLALGSLCLCCWTPHRSLHKLHVARQGTLYLRGVWSSREIRQLQTNQIFNCVVCLLTEVWSP